MLVDCPFCGREAEEKLVPAYFSLVGKNVSYGGREVVCDGILSLLPSFESSDHGMAEEAVGFLSFQVHVEASH